MLRTISYSRDLRAWARPLLPPWWPMSWVRTSKLPAVQPSGVRGTLLRSLRTSKEGDVLFIDEIHRLNRMVEEVLYPALEDFALDIVVGQGAGGSFHPLGPAALHAHRRHHPYGSAYRSSARPLRRGLPPAVLHA